MKKPDSFIVRGIGRLLLIGLLITSCQKDTLTMEEKAPSDVQKVKAFENLSLCPNYEVPAHMDRHEKGSACIRLFEDKSLYFEIEVKNLLEGDQLTVAHIHDGGPLVAGSIIVALVDGSNISFANNKAKGTIQLTTEQYNRILTGNDIYINVHSMQQPTGLLRNQIGNPVIIGGDVSLFPENEVDHVVTSNASGKAMVRITTDKKLHSRVNVSNLEATDNLVISHIHRGAVGTNGPVIINLADNASQFGLLLVRDLSDEIFDDFKANPLYVNVHSTLYPAGLIRGQLKN